MRKRTLIICCLLIIIGGAYYLLLIAQAHKLDTTHHEPPAYTYESLVPVCIGKADDKAQYAYANEKGKVNQGHYFDFAGSFINGLAAVGRNGKFGFINEKFEVEIPFEYDKVEDFFGDTTVVRQGELSFLINRKGAKVSPDGFYMLGSYSEGLARFLSDRKTGFVNGEGQVVLEPKFNEALDFKNSVAAVRRYSKWELIDKSGTLVSSQRYDKMLPATDGNYAIQYTALLRERRLEYKGSKGSKWTTKYSVSAFEDVKATRCWGVINDSEDYVILPSFVEMSPFVSGNTVVKIEHKVGCEGGMNGQTSLPPIFDIVSENFGHRGLFICGLGGKFFLCSSSGTPLCQPKYDYIFDDWGSSPTFRAVIDGKFTLINEMGEEVLSERFDGIFTGGGFVSRNNPQGIYGFSDGGKYGMLSGERGIIVPAEYDSLRVLDKGTCAVKVGDKWRVLDEFGEFLVEPVFLDVGEYERKCASAKTEQGWGLIDNRGEFIIQPIYNEIDHYGFVEFFTVVDKNGDRCLMAWDGTVIRNVGKGEFCSLSSTGRFEVSYGKRTLFFNLDPKAELYCNKCKEIGQYILVEKDNAWCVYNQALELQPELGFEDVSTEYGDYNLIPVKKDGKWGYIDDELNFTIPPIYDTATEFCNGFAKVTLDGRTYYIDKEGTEVPDDIAKEPAKTETDQRENDGSWIDDPQIGIFTPPGKYIPIKGVTAFGDASRDLIAVFNGSLWGYCNWDGKMVIEPKFEVARGFIDDRAIVKEKDCNYVLIDMEGRQVTQQSFDAIEEIGRGSYKFRTGYMWGILNTSGEIVRDAEFFEIGSFVPPDPNPVFPCDLQFEM